MLYIRTKFKNIKAKFIAGKGRNYKMLKKLSLFALLSYITIAMALPVLAQYTTGVKAGDWIKYDFNISYMGMSYKGTLTVTIQTVTDTYITGTITFTGNFPMAGQPTFSIHIPTWTGGNGFLIPSNLKPGQTIPGIYPTTTVQEIVNWKGRNAIKATTTMTGFQTEVYWDQETGVLLEIKSITSGADFSVVATDTNMFSIGGFNWTLWIIIIVVIIIAAITFIVIWYKVKRPVTPSTAQPQPTAPPPPAQGS